MAIVEMKRIDLLAMRQDQRKLLRTLQDMGCVEITPLQDEALAEYRTRDDGRLEQVDALLARLSWVIHECAAYNHQPAPFMGNLPEASAQDVHYITQQEAALQETLRQAETLEKRSGEYRGQLMRLQVAQSQLKPWLSFDLPMEQMHNTRRVAHFLGTVKAAELQQCQEKWASLPVVVEQLSAEHDTAAVWICAHQSAREQVAADLRDAGFAPAQLPEFTGTAAEQSARLENEKNEILRQQEALVQDWKALSAELTHLKVWYDALTIERDQLEAARQTIGTGKAFLLRGWVPAEVAQQVADKCRSLAPTCSVDITDPAEGDEPPVLLDNNRVNAPYESVVEGFALPAYRSVDPTAVMAPFYACLFGMMLSDAGYGLVMIVGILALIFLKKPAKKNARLLWVLFGGAVMTVVWGAAYNTWMGFTAPWGGLLDPMNDPMPVMMICLAVGVIHLYAGLGMAAYLNFKRGKPLDALYDQFSWIFALTGLGLYALCSGTLQTIGLGLTIFGVALLLLFGGREKKNPFARLLGGLSQIYGATSWISDILSYMRLFGMGLATGVMGQVIDMLVGMIFQNGPIGFSARCCSSARTRSALASTPWARMFMPAACSILSSSASSLRKAAWHSARCSAGQSTSASARKPGVRIRNFRLILKEVTCHGIGFGDWFVCCGDCRDSARHGLCQGGGSGGRNGGGCFR